MTKYKLGYSFILFLLLAANIFAQTGKLEGKLVDIETGEPLLGANIVLKGTRIGAATNPDGNYIINKIPPGVYDIVASYIGYTQSVTKNVKVEKDTKKKLNIALSRENNSKTDPEIAEFYLKTLNLDKETNDELQEIRNYDSNIYVRLVVKLYFENLSRGNKSAIVTNKINLNDQITALTVKSNLIAVRYKKSSDAGKKKILRSELKKSLEKLFTLKLEQRQDDLDQITKKLDDLKISIKDLKNRKIELISEKINELLK